MHWAASPSSHSFEFGMLFTVLYARLTGVEKTHLPHWYRENTSRGEVVLRSRQKTSPHSYMENKCSVSWITEARQNTLLSVYTTD